MPNFSNHRITAGARGADPDANKRVELSPKPDLIFLATMPLIIGIHL